MTSTDRQSHMSTWYKLMEVGESLWEQAHLCLQRIWSMAVAHRHRPLEFQLQTQGQHLCARDLWPEPDMPSASSSHPLPPGLFFQLPWVCAMLIPCIGMTVLVVPIPVMLCTLCWWQHVFLGTGLSAGGNCQACRAASQHKPERTAGSSWSPPKFGLQESDQQDRNPAAEWDKGVCGPSAEDREHWNSETTDRYTADCSSLSKDRDPPCLWSVLLQPAKAR